MTKKYIDDAHSHISLRPWFGQLQEAKGGDYDFAIISDRTGGAVQGMFEKGLEAAQKLNPEFIISIGDIVEGYWTDEVEAHEEWDRMDALLEGVGIPLFQTVGNHDYSTSTMKRVWRERKGVDYYAFRYGKSLFLVLNTEAEDYVHDEKMVGFIQMINRHLIKNPELTFAEATKAVFGEQASNNMTMTEDWLIQPHLSSVQIDFFEKVIADNTDVEWTFVCLHQPAWKKDDPLFTRLENLLNGRQFTVVAGHVHYLEVTEKNGSQYIQMGKTGGLHCFKGKGDIHHILSVKMRNGVPNIEVILLEGEGGTESLDGYMKSKSEQL
ncbi:hypothetical protein A8709_02970 [Paenibacillus pectinilyticus]|uniref:Calcineurin-like phosphoesterase domain-containing protein n=1 Tax=Paenibacillus pectinilyticus TaxID=512399 RepID=A0A1C1A775_9BACL|nr:metallophosphoesterase [Paenibacillus pectinilyticus]OCT16406.1 hypothetical protein A8709_02970 [Paenibacillus pectinilyticus]